jgi:ubiquinone/menaquinone biosynthesis C-methylase UbiE
MIDDTNQAGFNYWNSSWETDGIQSLSLHSTVIEDAKWKYLIPELHGYSGQSLEVGCGSGHFSALMAEKGFEAILLDYSPSAIICARNSFIALKGRERKKYLLGDALALPIADGKMDVVLSCGTLEHFEHPIEPIREMVRVLRKGGLFYADICPRKFTLIGMLDFLYKKAPGWYEAKLSKREIIDILQNAGLEDVRIFAAGVLPPRNIPGKGKIALIRVLERFIIERFKSFWISLDGTKIADWMGLYYFITAKKRRSNSADSYLYGKACSS